MFRMGIYVKREPDFLFFKIFNIYNELQNGKKELFDFYINP